MSADQPTNIETIFKAAIKLPVEQRQAYLDRQCGADAELRSLVEKLLINNDRGMSGFLEAPEQSRDDLFTQPAIEGKWIDRYQLVRSIGQGGMGRVYLARQQKPHRDVALKILRNDLAIVSHTRRFKLEIEVLGHLNHPGIAQIYDAGTTEDGSSYFAMEYVPGESLSDFLRNHDLPPRKRLSLVIQICDAVHYANEKGIVHRDLKPANIMVVDRGRDDYQAKILDFGVAHVAQDLGLTTSANTLPGQLLGTLAYMSPEQAAGNYESMTPSSDVYQLGVILFEILAGRLPRAVATEKIPVALRQIIEEDPPNLDTDDKSLSGDLAVIVAKAMAKEPERRYTIAGELAADIHRFLNGEPIEARPTTALYLLRRKVQNHRRAILGFTMMIAVSLTAGWVLFQSNIPPNLKPAVLTMITPTFPVQEEYICPAISPDGSQLAVIERPSSLNLLSVFGKQERTLVPGIEGQNTILAVAWHPSEEKLLLTRSLKDIGYQQVWYDLTSGEQSVLLSGQEVLRPVISPDGKSAIVRRNSYRELAIMNLATGDIHTLATAYDNRQFHTPVWGPKSQRVAVVEAVQGLIYTVECLDLQGGKTKLLENLLLDTYSFQSSLFWLPDGRLLYALNRDVSGTGGDLWAIQMDPKTCIAAGDPQLVYSLPTLSAREFSYSTEADRLAFSGRKTTRTVALFDIGPDGGLTRADLPSIGWLGRPRSFVNDGKHLVIGKTLSQNDTDALLQDITTGEFKPLLVGPGNDNPIAMSTNGQYLFLFRGDKNLLHAELWAHCLADSQTVYLDYTLAEDDCYKWISSPVRGDGSSYLFSQWGTDLVVRNISAKKGVGPEMLRLPISAAVSPSQSVLSVDMSPDAQRIAYLVNYHEIQIHELTTKENVTIPVDLGYVQGLQWSIDGEWIYIRGVKNPEALFWFGRVEVATGLNEFLWGSETQHPNEFYMSSDGRHLSCQLYETGAALGILEGL